MAPDMNWFQSSECRERRRELYRLATQFHRQSHGFGLSALYDENVEDLFERGFFKMPNGKPSMFTRIPISNYYIRRVCYYKHTFDDGYQCWFVRPFAVKLLQKRSAAILSNFAISLRERAKNSGVDITLNLDDVADYMMNWRGRAYADELPDRTYLGMIKPLYYMYASIADYNHFNHRFLSMVYLGCKDAYKRVTSRVFPLQAVIDDIVCNQEFSPRFSGYDDFISRIDKYFEAFSDNRQAEYDNRQRLKTLYKSLQLC
ncbi:MAG: hypothetical protein IJ622_01805 [Bacteroidales bacterium]|nr:hypothetical protein [Bacteroidales bacterium]